MPQEILVLFPGTRPAVAHFSSRMQGPVGIREVRARQADQIRASGGDDAVDVINFVDVAHRDGFHAPLITDQIGQGGLEHAAGLGFGIVTGLARGDIDDVSPRLGKGLGNGQGVLFGYAGIAHPVMGGDAH